jgi:WhiB family redox-sensing transcriptional regulator
MLKYELIMAMEALNSDDSDYDLRACAGPDAPPELFFPDPFLSKAERVDVVAVAKMICDSCIIKDACLTGAYKRNEQNGIWGGVDFTIRNERKNARARYRA